MGCTVSVIKGMNQTSRWFFLKSKEKILDFSHFRAFSPFGLTGYGRVGTLICLLGGLMITHSGGANPVVRQIEKATPIYRVIHLINYFDTCQAITTNKQYAFKILRAIEHSSVKLRDDRLRRYVRYTRDTFARNGNGTNQQKAALFLAVGQQATDDNDPQIAAVCQHFAGQYYFLSGEYGKAFQHLLAANRAFHSVGLQNIPPVSRFMYELAFNYYYFQEYERAIPLLRKAAAHAPFSANLNIQTYNTMALAYAQLGIRDSVDRAENIGRAERNYLKSQRLATLYRDSVWIGITAGNLAALYRNQQRWTDALRAFQLDYRLGIKFGGNRYYPTSGALGVATAFINLGQLDSCRYYLEQSQKLYRLNLAMPDFARNLGDEHYLRQYYEVMRQYCQGVDNPRLANRYADSLLLITARITTRTNARQLLLAEQKLLIQKYESEVAVVHAEKDSQQTLFWLIALGLTALAGLLFRLLQLSGLHRRQEREIEATKEKSLRLEKQTVEDELQQAQDDLIGFVENLHNKNALIDTLTTQLGDFGPVFPKSLDTPLNDARQKLIDSSLLTKDDWDEFQRRFERVHPSFFWQLRTQFPDITPAEERLLALSKLCLGTSQMARMLGISPTSVHKTKYRLRKKHGIAAGSPLSNLLNSSLEDSLTN